MKLHFNVIKDYNHLISSIFLLIIIATRASLLDDVGFTLYVIALKRQSGF